MNEGRDALSFHLTQKLTHSYGAFISRSLAQIQPRLAVLKSSLEPPLHMESYATDRYSFPEKGIVQDLLRDRQCVMQVAFLLLLTSQAPRMQVSLLTEVAGSRRAKINPTSRNELEFFISASL
ncbi:unnamed protein product [Caretta caretta]